MKIIKALLTLLLIWSSLACSTRHEFYVSPEGDDLNSGSRKAPFATLARARLAVQDALSSQDSDITVWLSGGVYPLDDTLRFTGEDSGRNRFGIHYRSLPGQTPVISGGIELKNWKKEADRLWSAAVPEAALNCPPRELFVGGIRAPRARTPNDGFLRIKKAGEDKRTSFYFNQGDFVLPEDPDKVELVLLHDWSISRIRIKEIDPIENRLTASDSIGAESLDFFDLDHWEPNPRYFLENSRTFLDADNEWYLDPGARCLYLQLPENLNPESLSIVIPFSAGLLSLKGEADNLISGLSFEGITFSHCGWQLPETGYAGIQACHFDRRSETSPGEVVPGAVHGEWVENCSFSNCTFSHLGGSGLHLGTGSKGCSITDCIFTDISGNGIMIGEGQSRQVRGESWWKSAPDEAASGNTVERCRISECGQQFFGAVGIWCGLVAETVLRENEIAELPYSGISIGWMWSPDPTPCRENVVERNHIHHIMQTLSDGGGIYMLGLQPGSRLSRNQIHAVRINAGRAESNGMFIDEGSTGLIVSGNLIYDIARAPLRFHRATTNLVEENHLFCTGDNPPIRYNHTREEDIVQKNNQVFRESEPGYRQNLERLLQQWE